jgi:tripartite-type tricarboxylate transporter receptor subunit TctC
MKKGVYIKTLVMVLLFLAFLSFTSQTSWAKYPEKPITIIMCWPPGGTMDISMRPLAQAAGQSIAQLMVIEYRAGASGSVGMGLLKTKKPDGYTLGVTSAGSVAQQHLAKVGYDITKDFTCIIQYADVAYGLVVRADSPWKTFQDLVEYAKANPGKIRYSTPSPAGSNALTMAALSKRFRIDWTNIAFAGGAPALTALLGGHVEAYSATIGGCKSHIVSGRLRLLAAFGEKRIPSFPDVPNINELGYPIMFPLGYYIFGPKGLSADVLESLHQAFKKGLQDPDFIKACAIGESVIIYRNPKEMAEHILQFNKEMEEIIRELKIGKE